MKARDLRIGNIIHDPDKGADGYTYVTARIINALDAHPKSCNHSPIPLTEEWLVRLGFVRCDGVERSGSFYEIAISNSTLAVNPDNGVVWIFNPRGEHAYNPPSVRYVHQIQNLYHALTLTELHINTQS